MKKQFITTALLAVCTAGIAVGTIEASAKDYSGKSDSKVEFESGTIVIPPVTPPVDPPITPPDTDFGLLYVPKEFNFKKTAVPATPTALTINIDSTVESVAGANPTTKHVAMADLRGTYVGWKLEAKMTELEGTTDSTRKLTGATITMSQALKEVTDPATNTISDVVSTAQQPTAVTGVTLTTTNTRILTGDATKGQGYWAGELTNIQLNIPASVSPVANETYKGTVDWTLTDSI
ncbi:WxL domain-containing protein [Candidatus Enterococcus clewellii]|uniref:WxL domain-containing protein n=1 Tax=Candidatus Enterococcus clewellii TaxID=1834193 RepID=A0A242K3U0_9ENTE|nr:WxL domain-containing protein [Enterococcus sp. 9E7_DIV0242]OTP13665.1 hypothetical protein A5888_003143 [Enterococcus sp. 9E7_DIV0242]